MKFQVKMRISKLLTNKSPMRVLLLALLVQPGVFSQELPLGYISYFSDNCSNESLFNFLIPEKESEWVIVKEEGQNFLRIKPANDSTSQSFPECRSVLNNMILGDYILEFDVKFVHNPDSDTAGFCFLGPMKDKGMYYSMIFSMDTVDFYSVYNDSIQSSIKKSIASMKTSWNSIRIERDILSRTIHIIINKDLLHKVSFSNRSLVMGYIGFGTHNTTSYIKNIRLWAPTAIEQNSFQW
jgi:hypothetical protein